MRLVSREVRSQISVGYRQLIWNEREQNCTFGWLFGSLLLDAIFERF